MIPLGTVKGNDMRTYPAAVLTPFHILPEDQASFSPYTHIADHCEYTSHN